MPVGPVLILGSTQLDLHEASDRVYITRLELGILTGFWILYASTGSGASRGSHYGPGSRSASREETAGPT
jgi:hypothetical protein